MSKRRTWNKFFGGADPKSNAHRDKIPLCGEPPYFDPNNKQSHFDPRRDDYHQEAHTTNSAPATSSPWKNYPAQGNLSRKPIMGVCFPPPDPARPRPPNSGDNNDLGYLYHPPLSTMIQIYAPIHPCVSLQPIMGVCFPPAPPRPRSPNSGDNSGLGCT